MKPGSDAAIAMMRERIKQDMASHMDSNNLDIFKEVTGKFMRFIEEQSPRIDKDIVVLGVEEELNVPVQLPSGRIISLFGFIDLRYSSGSYRGIRDHKTGEKAWKGSDVGLSNQLLHYDTAVLLMTDETYAVEINFVNTHEYAKKIPSFEEVFTFGNHYHTRRGLEIYLEQTCQLIDEMLDCKPTPHYDERVCNGCPYRLPCTLERRGIDPSPILGAHYVPRNETPSERSFTNQDTDGDETD